ncbi:MAG TPA: YraN family protein [Capsulimonadaceae bacterium]|jgi:putative endonuclease
MPQPETQPGGTKALGACGEAQAAEYLVAQGYRIAETNVRPLPGFARGEIDIVAYDGDVLCFIEVKTRRSGTDAAAESVNPAKRRQLVVLAEAYLSTREIGANVMCRFDVVAISAKCGVPHITLYRDAFSPE